MPPDTGPRPRKRRRGRGVPPRSGPSHAHRRLRTAEPVRGVSRRAIRPRQPRLRPVAGDEVPVVRATRCAWASHPGDPPREEPPRHRGGGNPARPDLPGGARADGGGGCGLGETTAPPRGRRSVGARGPSDGALADAEGAEGPPVAARALRGDRLALDRLRGAAPAHERPRPLGPGTAGT